MLKQRAYIRMSVTAQTKRANPVSKAEDPT